MKANLAFKQNLSILFFTNFSILILTSCKVFDKIIIMQDWNLKETIDKSGPGKQWSFQDQIPNLILKPETEDTAYSMNYQDWPQKYLICSR